MTLYPQACSFSVFFLALGFILNCIPFQAFIAEVMVEKPDEEPQMIKLFNSQLQQLLPQLPETDAEVSDSLFDMLPRPISFTPSPKKDKTLSRFKPL